MLQAVAFAENLSLVKVLHQEVVLAGESEGVELVLVVAQTNGSLSEGGLGGARQVRAIHFGSSKQLHPWGLGGSSFCSLSCS